MEPAPICLNCGLCCDGSLFADVKIAADDAGRLATVLPAFAARGKTRQWRLPQPCFAFRAGVCSIYSQRPSYCRKFDCDLLQQVQEGKKSREEALAILRQCRAKVDQVSRLLRLLGNRNDGAPLSLRFRQAARLAAKARGNRRHAVLFGELSVAMHALNCMLSEHIYPV